jgi:ABC-2 type transport system permease protein
MTLPKPLHAAMNLIWAFLQRDIYKEISYRLSFLLQLIGIFPAVLMFHFLSRLVDSGLAGPLGGYGGAYFPFVLIGIAVQNYLTQSLSAFSSSLREAQLTGTIEVVLSTPISLPLWLAGEAAYSFVLSTLRIFIYLLAGQFLFGVSLHWEHLPQVMLTLFLTICAITSIGFVSAAFILVFKKGDPLNWGFSVLSWLLGGVYYPITVLPEWLQHLALSLPICHSLEALRICLLGGQGYWSLESHLMALALWAMIGLPIGYLCVRWAIQRCRRRGTLGHY